MTRVLRWEEPPPNQLPTRPWTTRHSHLKELADELRARPGNWALVFEQEGPASGRAGAMATHIRLGQVRCFTPTGDFDAVTRKVENITCVYARYVGEPDGEDLP